MTSTRLPHNCCAAHGLYPLKSSPRMRATPVPSSTSTEWPTVKPPCGIAATSGFTQQLDGMTRVSGLLDPESAAHIVVAADAALAPRRGPRFVDPEAAAAAEELVRDPRSNEQILLDTFVELTRIAVAAPGHKHPRQTTPRGADPRHRPRPPSTPRCRLHRRTTRPGLHRDDRTLPLRLRIRPDPLRRRRTNPQPRTRTPHLHHPTTHRPRRTRRRMPNSQLQLPTLLDRSTPHHPMVRQAAKPTSPTASSSADNTT